MKKAVFAVLFASTILVGCSTLQPPLRQMAVDSNRLAAETADQQSLLNVLRAKDRLPMHFSSFRYIRGNLQVTTSAGLGGSLVEQGTQVEAKSSNAPAGITNEVTNTLSNGVDTFSPTIGVSAVSNPNFEMAVFDTKEFQSGISTPVKPSLIEFFLSQGWPEDFLTAVFTATVDIEITPNKALFGDQKVPYRYHIKNDPRKSDDNKAYDFGKFINFFEMTHEDKKGSEKEVVELKSINDLNLADISILDGSKFEIKRKSKPLKDEKSSVCSVDSNCIVRKISGGRGISLKVRNGHNKNGLTDIGRFPDGLLKNDLVARLSKRISSKSKKGSKIADAKTNYIEAWASLQRTTLESSETEPNSSAIDEAQKHLNNTAAELYRLSKDEFVHSKITTEKDLLQLDLQCQKISFIDNVEDEGEGCSILLNGSLIGKMKITSIFRSPQSVIYFLGKYSRTSDEQVYKIHNHGDKSESAQCGTFVIRVNEGVSRKSIISTKHRGKYYSINKSTDVSGCNSIDQRSSQAIALVQQLVNLHKSAENLPSTTAIQITP